MSLKKNTTTAETLVNTLLKLGVDSIFGYPGASVLSIYNELAGEALPIVTPPSSHSRDCIEFPAASRTSRRTPSSYLYCRYLCTSSNQTAHTISSSLRLEGPNEARHAG